MLTNGYCKLTIVIGIEMHFELKQRLFCVFYDISMTTIYIYCNRDRFYLVKVHL